MPEVCANCVLLVDDESPIRNLVSIHLEKAGFQAIHANDGIDALVKLRDTIPSVIISELEMPRMSGFEFIAVVRRRFPTIPVVVHAASIPSEFSVDIKPDYWFVKGMPAFPELMQTVSYLARKAPNHIDLPQVISMPVRARPEGADYIVLTCSECLRLFGARSAPGNKAVEGTAVCTHCGARVPFSVETPEPQ
jgi:CheY-like chemotaxis protein/DNA-directed RNA polymerase subunit RPC12/RpoP